MIPDDQKIKDGVKKKASSNFHSLISKIDFVNRYNPIDPINESVINTND
jgi:hypothetical protein